MSDISQHKKLYIPPININANNRKLLCPNCNRLPLISIVPDHFEKIKVICNYCKYNEELLIPEYLRKVDLNKTNFQTYKENFHCKSHQFIEYKFFCNDCNKHLCTVCVQDEKHKDHNVIDLTTVSIYTLKNDLENARNEFIQYFTAIKKELMEEINKKIEMMSKAHDLLTLIEVLSNTFDPKTPNHYLISNMLNITQVKLNLNDNNKKFENFKFCPSIVQISFPSLKLEANLKEHSKGILSLIKLKDGRLASSSEDNNIILYRNMQKDATLKAHTEPIHSLSQLDNEKIISCSNDKSIKIWTKKGSTYVVEETIENAHDDFIYKVIPLTLTRMASCSKDGTIKIWSSDPPYQPIKTLGGDKGIVISILQLKNQEKLLAAYPIKNEIGLWNITNYECEKVYGEVNCCYVNSMIQLDDKKIAIGGITLLTVFDMEKEEKEVHLLNRTLITSLRKIDEDNLLFGTKEGVIGVYKIKTKEVGLISKVHNDCISDIVLNEKNSVITTSWEGDVKKWKY